MPASQLKRLKASLREQGITGPQKPNKAKRRDASERGVGAQRSKREATLARIRDSFNPFEVQSSSRPRKFDITTNKPTRATNAGSRPGITKSQGEQTRRNALLPELRRRNKVGGILDRRIGENDPFMTPEERAELRFAKTSGRARTGAFDLEDDTEDVLTHLGQSLATEGRDDFDEHISQASSDLEDEGSGLKRKRDTSDGAVKAVDTDMPGQPERKKTKAEVMQEVIAKSKLHKYERQQAKEDDDELREELDRGMGDLMAILHGHQVPGPITPSAVDVESSINPDRLALLNGADRAILDKQYDSRIKQMTMDQRAQPTDRSKTEDEQAKEQAERLQKLEEDRLARMRGGRTPNKGDSDEDEDDRAHSDAADLDDAVAFGLNSEGDQRYRGYTELDVEDEDDFIIDDDLVASGSDLEEGPDNFVDHLNVSGQADTNDDDPNDLDQEEDELLPALLTKDEREALYKGQQQTSTSPSMSQNLPYAFECPTSHIELLAVLEGIPETDIPLTIQRIRALYDPRAAAENKAKLATFSAALVSHIVYLGDSKPPALATTIDTVIRHVHSLSRTFADSISAAFQHELRKLANGGPTPGRLCLLTAVGTIYPTSDHFHQVVTPAITLMARWLGLTNPKTALDLTYGAYIGAQCLSYQRLSKRYVPELVRFICLALQCNESPASLITAQLANLDRAMDLWTDKAAFPDIIANVLSALQRCTHESADAYLRKLNTLLHQTRLVRRPLELHNHRPLPIKTAVPQFEDNFNPDKHYDPNFARSEANKLKSEYKRERKGALRELRKDANFVARERLREKRERDRAHEEKERRIVAEINAEGGQERNEYERERKRRRGR